MSAASQDEAKAATVSASKEEADDDEPPKSCTGLMGVCRKCLKVNFFDTSESSSAALQVTPCPTCAGAMWLPDEILRFFALFGHFVPRKIGACFLLSALRVPETLLPHFVASFSNGVTEAIQTDYVYDVALPRGSDGLGMKIQKQGEHVIIGGFTHMSNGLPGMAENSKKMSIGDVLVAINKDSVRTMSFTQQVEALSTTTSPLYLTFVRGADRKSVV